MTHSSVLYCLESRTLTWWPIPGTHLRPGTRPSSCALFSSNIFTKDINKSTSHLSKKKKKAFFQMLGWSFVTHYEEPSFFFLTAYPNLLHIIRLPCNFISLTHGTLHLWLKLYVSLYFSHHSSCHSSHIHSRCYFALFVYFWYVCTSLDSPVMLYIQGNYL